MIHIACAADESYMGHCAAMVHSAITHANFDDGITIHFLHDAELSETSLQRLRCLVEKQGAYLTNYCLDINQFNGLDTMSRISSIMWYRVLLPELLQDCDKVLYLDCDIIVMDSLEALWHTELENFYLAAVDNVFLNGMESRAKAVGLDSPNQYFNSGVMLLNLQLWRRDQCTHKVLDYARVSPEKLVWPDQDALNAVLARRRVTLHPRWNCPNACYYFPDAIKQWDSRLRDEALTQPGILHFEGPKYVKPWHYLCKNPYQSKYWHHRIEMGWSEAHVEGRTALNLILRLLPIQTLPKVVHWLDKTNTSLRNRNF